MNVTADGSAGEAWRSRYKEFANAVGLLITVNVADVCRNANVGTRKCEGTNNAEYLKILYSAFFNREPDDAGYKEPNISQLVILIEIIKVHKKPVISDRISSKFGGFKTCACHYMKPGCSACTFRISQEFNGVRT